MRADADIARPRDTGELQKARYRALVMVLLALFGPPAFGIPVGLFSVLFSILLIGYAFWALRLTVVFHDDLSLGLILAVFDIAITLPLLAWGSTSWLTAPFIGLWVCGLASSLLFRRHALKRRQCKQSNPRDAVTGLCRRHLFPIAFEEECGFADARDEYLGILVLRIARFSELQALSGTEAADGVVAAIARRAVRRLGGRSEGFRTGQDEIAFLIPGVDYSGMVRTAEEVSRAVNERLVDGRKIEVYVGSAVYPRDGLLPEEVLSAAARASLPPQTLRPISDKRISGSTPSVIAG